VPAARKCPPLAGLHSTNRKTNGLSIRWRRASLCSDPGHAARKAGPETQARREALTPPTAPIINRWIYFG